MQILSNLSLHNIHYEYIRSLRAMSEGFHTDSQTHIYVYI